MRWTCCDRYLELGDRPQIMGILNVTPDSFSDGGRFVDQAAAAEHAVALCEAGAAIIDVGGESTRPGAAAVSLDEELERVLPVIEGLSARSEVLISVDTTKAEVARQAIAAGAHIINDVSAASSDAAMPTVVRDTGAGVVLMHMQGCPQTMQEAPRYVDVVREVREYLFGRVEALVACGVSRDHVVLDPGIGFGKTLEHNVALLADVAQLGQIGLPIVVGLSRKRFLGDLTGQAVAGRQAGSLAALVFCVLQGVQIMRVHDVRESCDAVAVITALEAARVACEETTKTGRG